MIDLKNLKKTTVSRDLKGKYLLLYGPPKSGKTSFCANFDKNLLLAFEIGYNAIDGIYAQPVQKWSEFKQALRELEDPQVHEMFDTVTIDTVSIAYDLATKFVCAQQGIQKINEIPYGGGYAMVKEEVESCFRKITMMGYGLILIAHSETKTMKIGESDVEYQRPALDKRCYEICNRLVDVIGYIGIEWQQDGTSKRYLYTRQTPTVMAGSRWKYLAPKIEFGYLELINAVGEAINKQRELDGATVVDNAPVIAFEAVDFNAVMKEAKDLWTSLITKDEANATVLSKKIEIIFGHKQKLSEATEDQCDLVELMIDEMKNMLK